MIKSVKEALPFLVAALCVGTLVAYVMRTTQEVPPPLRFGKRMVIANATAQGLSNNCFIYAPRPEGPDLIAIVYNTGNPTERIFRSNVIFRDENWEMHGDQHNFNGVITLVTAVNVDDDDDKEILVCFSNDDSACAVAFDWPDERFISAFTVLKRDFPWRGTDRWDTHLAPAGEIALDSGRKAVVVYVHSGFGRMPKGIAIVDFSTPNAREIMHHWIGGTATEHCLAEITGDSLPEIIFGTGSGANGGVWEDTDDLHAYLTAIDAKGKRIWIKRFSPAFTQIHVTPLDDSPTPRLLCLYSNNSSTPVDSLFVVDPRTGNCLNSLVVENSATMNEMHEWNPPPDSGLPRIRPWNSGPDSLKRYLVSKGLYDQFVVDGNLNLQENDEGYRVRRLGDFDRDGLLETMAFYEDGVCCLRDDDGRVLAKIPGVVDVYGSQRASKLEWPYIWVNSSEGILRLRVEPNPAFRYDHVKRAAWHGSAVLAVFVLFFTSRHLTQLWRTRRGLSSLQPVLDLMDEKTLILAYDQNGSFLGMSGAGLGLLGTEDARTSYPQLCEISAGARELDRLVKDLVRLPAANRHRKTNIRLDANAIDVRILSERADELFRGAELVIMIRDDSHQALAERTLDWAEIARQISHQLKSPLSSIAATKHHLSRFAPQGDDQQAQQYNMLMKSLDHSVIRMTDFCNQLNLFLGLLKSDDGSCDLIQILSGRIDRYAADHQDRITFQFRHDTGPVVIGLSANLCERLFEILIDNAIQAIDGQGAIECHVAVSERLNTGSNKLKVDQFVETRIVDSGKGIPRDQLQRVFELFYTTKPSGSGLGLYIAQQLAQRCGGSIRIASELGIMTTVTVDLPMMDESRV